MKRIRFTEVSQYKMAEGTKQFEEGEELTCPDGFADRWIKRGKAVEVPIEEDKPQRRTPSEPKAEAKVSQPKPADETKVEETKEEPENKGSSNGGVVEPDKPTLRTSSPTPVRPGAH